MRTLVLNAGYEPLAVISFKRALVLVLNGKATVVAADMDHPVFGSSGAWDRPSVILLTRYVRLPGSRHIPVTRRGVLRRDEFRCAYCGRSASTIDHVIPRSRGGADTWENLVACCRRCNSKKGDKSLNQTGMRLRREPRRPRYVPYISLSKYLAGQKNEVWRNYLPAVPGLAEPPAG